MKTLDEIERISLEHPVMFFDGECIFCTKALQFFIKVDTEELIRYTTLQSEEGQLLMDRLHISEDMDSVLLVDNGQYFTRSDVTFHLMKKMKYPWRALSILIYIPKVIRDFFYGIVAKYRYKIFGKYDQCMIPSAEQKHLFINV